MGNVLMSLGVDIGCNMVSAHTNLDDVWVPFVPAVFLLTLTYRLTNYRCGEALSVEGWKRYCLFYKWNR